MTFTKEQAQELRERMATLLEHTGAPLTNPPHGTYLGLKETELEYLLARVDDDIRICHGLPTA